MSDNQVNQWSDAPDGRSGDRKPNLSPDGKWKRLPRASNLLQSIPSEIYFGRVKAGGKDVRVSLETDVFTTAKLRLGDFLKNQRNRAVRSILGTFGEIDADHTLKDASKLYRRNCIKALLRTWPNLDAKAPGKISEGDCRTWASRFAATYDDQFFDNTLSTLRSGFPSGF